MKGGTRLKLFISKIKFKLYRSFDRYFRIYVMGALADGIVKCPVCEGRGIVKPGFYYYPPDGFPTRCRRCTGSGTI